MKFKKFINENSDILDALDIENPKVGEKYTEDEAKENIEIIKVSVKKQEKILNGMNKEKDQKYEMEKAVLKDLIEKLEKWKNWKEEIKMPEAPKPKPKEEEPEKQEKTPENDNENDLEKDREKNKEKQEKRKEDRQKEQEKRREENEKDREKLKKDET